MNVVTAPIRKQIEVELPLAEAFSLFTDGFGSWWPLASHSIFEQDAVDCVIEPRLGGRIYEVASDGRENEWGSITAWDPPGRLEFSWNPNPHRAVFTEVEVTFVAIDGGTRVELEHRGWEAMLVEAPALRDSYLTGWDPVLERFRDATQRG